jgi:acetolactate synthase small subunit
MADRDIVEEKLDTLIDLMKQLVAVEMARSGVPRNVIAKRIKVANAKIGPMLEGIRKTGD